MSEPIPAIQSAFLNICQAERHCGSAIDAWQDEAWGTCLEFIEWVIEDLQAAKGKVEREYNKTKGE